MLWVWVNITFIIFLKRKKKVCWSIIWQALCWGETTVEMMVLEEFVGDECPQILFSVYLFKEDYEGRYVRRTMSSLSPATFFNAFFYLPLFFTCSCNNCIIYERLGHYLEMHSKSCQGEYWRTKGFLMRKFFSYTASDIFYDMQLFSWMCFVLEMGNLFTFWTRNFL